MELRPETDSSQTSLGQSLSREGGADAVVVSAYGRGNWLASELASRGWRVTLADVSESLGPWEPEDAEGPFGLLESSDLIPSQKTRLLDEGETVSVPQGFTFWLKSGAIECRSELTAFQLEKRGIPKAVESYLRRPGMPDKDADRDRKALAKRPFQETWLAHFAHQLASPVIEENHQGLESGVPMPLFTPFSIRQVTQQGWQKGLKACQSAGVKVRLKSTVKDLRLSGRSVDAIEIMDERSGVERGRAFVWMLSSSETQCYKNSVREALFPNGAVAPSWYWARFMVEMKGSAAEDAVPRHSVIVEDAFLPWTHANVFILRKRAEAKRYDVWVKLPARVRSEKDYLKGVAVEIETILQRRLPALEPSVLSLPTEAKGEIEKLGAPRVPVFEKDVLAKLHTLKAPNLFFSSPEQWGSLDWVGQFRQQNDILAKLEKLRAQWLAAEARLDAQRNSGQ